MLPQSSDTFWRRLLLSRILASAAIAPLSRSATEVSEAEPPVQCFTDDPGFSLPLSARAGSAGNGVIPTFQRHVPVFDGIAKLSRSANTETFLTASARLVLETNPHGQ